MPPPQPWRASWRSSAGAKANTDCPGSVSSRTNRARRPRRQTAVVVGQFFSGFDVAQRDDPHLAANLVGLAVRLARVIDERRYAEAVDDLFAAVQSK